MTRYSNPFVDELLTQGRIETDPAIRLEIYDEVQRFLRDDLAWIYLFQGVHLTAVNPSLRGFTLNPLGDKQHTFEMAYWVD